MSRFNSLIAAPLKDVAVHTSQALNPTTPLANLLDPRPRRLVEATGNSLTIDLDLGTDKDFNLIAVLFTNAAENATWSVRAASTRIGLGRGRILVGPETPLWASPATHMARRHGFAFLPAERHRWLRIAVGGGTIEGGRLQIGRIMVADALQPSWNHALGSSIARRPLVDEAVSRTGQVSRRLWQRRRILTMRLPELSEEELFGELMSIAEQADAEPVLIIQEPENSRYRMEKIFYGMLTMQTSKISPGEYDARLTLTEWS